MSPGSNVVLMRFLVVLVRTNGNVPRILVPLTVGDDQLQKSSVSALTSWCEAGLGWKLGQSGFINSAFYNRRKALGL